MVLCVACGSDSLGPGADIPAYVSEGTKPEKKPALQEPAIRKWRVFGVISRDPDIALAVALELGVHPGWLYWGLPPKELPY